MIDIIFCTSDRNALYLGISSTVSNKMNTVSSNRLHNLPPGVANMIPQYMMTGAGAAGIVLSLSLSLAILSTVNHLILFVMAS